MKSAKKWQVYIYNLHLVYTKYFTFSGEADYSEEEIGKYEGDILGLSTMYKIGSKPDLVMKSDGQEGYKVVDDYSGVSNEKPNLVFAKSESLADEEGKKKKLFQNTVGLNDDLGFRNELAKLTIKS